MNEFYEIQEKTSKTGFRKLANEVSKINLKLANAMVPLNLSRIASIYLASFVLCDCEEQYLDILSDN